MTPSSQSLALIKWSKPGIIYVARNRVNGKLYVGQTIQGKSRRQFLHENDARNGSQIVFHKAIRKYGNDSFDWFVVEECFDQHCLDAAENWWIVQLRTMLPNGYNQTVGGSRPMMSEEVKRKLSEAAKGRVISEETKRKISRTHTGMKRRAGTGEAISSALKGRSRPASTGTKNHFFGKHHSDESKARIGAKTRSRMTPEMRERLSAKKKGRKLSPETIAAIKKTKEERGLSDETRKKMSEASKAHAKRGKDHHWFGKCLSDEERKRISDMNKGRIVSEETRAKLRETSKGNKANLGRKFTDEHKRKIGEASRRNETWKYFGKRKKVNDSGGQIALDFG